jgi:hypothetical protein
MTNNDNRSEIERVVMRRVHTVRMLRLVVNGASASALVLFLSLYAIGREVWVAKVLTNGPEGLLGRLLYLEYAFLHTQVAVQVLTLLAVGAVVYLARETVRLTFTPRLVSAV